MRFLLDQDAYAGTTQFLKTHGHDALPIAEIGLPEAPDETLLKVTQDQKRILVTRDRDYGGLVFLKSLGAIRLRKMEFENWAHQMQSERERAAGGSGKTGPTIGGRSSGVNGTK